MSLYRDINVLTIDVMYGDINMPAMSMSINNM